MPMDTAPNTTERSSPNPLLLRKIQADSTASNTPIPYSAAVNRKNRVAATEGNTANSAPIIPADILLLISKKDTTKPADTDKRVRKNRPFRVGRL